MSEAGIPRALIPCLLHVLHRSQSQDVILLIIAGVGAYLGKCCVYNERRGLLSHM